MQAAPTLTKTFRHPVVGEVTVDCDSLTLTDRDQHLVLYTAPQGSRGAEALALLNVLGTPSPCPDDGKKAITNGADITLETAGHTVPGE